MTLVFRKMRLDRQEIIKSILSRVLIL